MTEKKVRRMMVENGKNGIDREFKARAKRYDLLKPSRGTLVVSFPLYFTFWELR